MQHNVSFTAAIKTVKTGTIVVTAGENRRTAPQTFLTTAARIPMGSVTKSWTAAAIMQLMEEGRFDIDLPIVQYVDPVMQRMNGTTMTKLWGGSPLLANVTARHVMGMRSGLNEYDDEAYAAWTYANPTQDWNPFDIIHALNKTFVCVPGTCGYYSSAGYELLGLALCQVHNCSTWEDLDQKAVLDRTPTLHKTLADTSFPERGKCSMDPHIPHQYRMSVTQPPAGSPNGTYPIVQFSDIINVSCLNGWTCGNIAVPVKDVVEWYWAVFGGEVVNATTLAAMINGVPLSKGWSPGLSYGLGLSKYHVSTDTQNLTWTVGHGGADWGSIAHMSGFNPKFNMSISVATTAVKGLNCSADYRTLYPTNLGSMYGDDLFPDVSTFA
jgi:D-alanyl-D-alanine carboxypeptidase